MRDLFGAIYAVTLDRAIPPRLWFAVLAATALIAASSCSASPPGTPRRLPSGRTIDVVWSGVLGESDRVWALKYWSRVHIEDRAALDDEAAEVWATVQGEADASGATRASLWPLNLDTHLLHFDDWWPVYQTVHSPEFSFERDQTEAVGSEERCLEVRDLNGYVLVFVSCRSPR
jgi:hypothetical protein